MLSASWDGLLACIWYWLSDGFGILGIEKNPLDSDGSWEMDRVAADIVIDEVSGLKEAIPLTIDYFPADEIAWDDP